MEPMDVAYEKLCKFIDQIVPTYCSSTRSSQTSLAGR